MVGQHGILGLGRRLDNLIELSGQFAHAARPSLQRRSRCDFSRGPVPLPSPMTPKAATVMGCPGVCPRPAAQWRRRAG